MNTSRTLRLCRLRWTRGIPGRDSRACPTPMRCVGAVLPPCLARWYGRYRQVAAFDDSAAAARTSSRRASFASKDCLTAGWLLAQQAESSRLGTRRCFGMPAGWTRSSTTYATVATLRLSRGRLLACFSPTRCGVSAATSTETATLGSPARRSGRWTHSMCRWVCCGSAHSSAVRVSSSLPRAVLPSRPRRNEGRRNEGRIDDEASIAEES